MSLFNRLFGKKPKAQVIEEPETKQQKEPDGEKSVYEPASTNELSLAGKEEAEAGKKPTTPPAPKPKKKKPSSEPEKVKETLPWRTFSIFNSSIPAERITCLKTMTTFTLSK
jgi:hypothetical protein